MAAIRLTPDQLALVAERFRALGEPSRLMILQALRGEERSVSELLDLTGLGQANVSKHLQTLHAAGFVARRKDGVSTLYRLADDDVVRLCDICCGRLEREAEKRLRLFGRPAAR